MEDHKNHHPRSEAEVKALIEDNLRLVLKIANDFIGRGLPWEDLVSEGNRGLMTAARRFDPNRGAKFSTYSAWWIKQAIRQAIIEQGKTVRIPIGTLMNVRKIRKTAAILNEEFGREATDREIAERAKLALLTVTRLRHYNIADMQSLNAPISNNDRDGDEFIDFMSDDTPAPDQQMIDLEDIEQLLALLDTLSERERQVIRLRFGLDGEPVRTLDEVGEVLHCTNERVRQIQNQALRKLQKRMESGQ